MNIAIFGGSFNPVHMGHFEIVNQSNMKFGFSKILVVPAYKNPLKDQSPSMPESIRKKMLSATFSKISNVEISYWELEKKQNSYSITTIEHFIDIYPNSRFFLLLGEDAFGSFHLWAKADRILDLCNLIVFHRQAIIKPETKELIKKSLDKIDWVDLNIPNISSTEIRQSSIMTIKKNSWLHPLAFPVWEKYQSGLIKHSAI